MAKTLTRKKAQKMARKQMRSVRKQAIEDVKHFKELMNTQPFKERFKQAMRLIRGKL